MRMSKVGRNRPSSIALKFAVTAAVSATVLAACSGGSTSSESTSAAASSAPAASSAAPAASSAAPGASSAAPAASSSSDISALVTKMFLTDVPVDSLDPAVKRTFEIASTGWTDAQQAKLMECLKNDVCETGNQGYVIAFPNDNINPWRQTFRAELTAQAIQSGKVSKVIYSLGADVPTWLANVKSLIAQKPDIMVIDSIYGPAILPVIKQAKEAGIVVVEAETPLPPEVSSVVDVQATSDLCEFYDAAAAAAIASMGEGKGYGLYTGVPGNGSAAVWQPCFEKSIQAGGWNKVIEGFTQWTPQGMTQEANALYSSGKEPAAVAYDYTMEYFAEPFLKDGKTPPLMISDVVNTAYLLQSADAIKNNVDIQGQIANGRSWYGRIGLTAGIMVKDGETVNQLVKIPYPSADLVKVLADFDTTMPANAPVPTMFNAAQETEILAAGS